MTARWELSRRSLLTTASVVGTAGLVGQSARAQVRNARRRDDPRRDFRLIEGGRPAGVLIDPQANSAVQHVARNFATDLQRVSGTAVELSEGTLTNAAGATVIIGVLGQSALIDGLVATGKIDVSDLHGEWEAFRQIVVDDLSPTVPRALVIVGSDRRGAVFGTYDISERIGVSPWHWFADVPVKQRRDVFIPAGSRRDQPRVRYRGFFINDEAPAFSGWAEKHFGGANAQMYAHVFELLLRLKGNYLWPAMWAPRAFAADDPQNMVVADAMGVVVGNSHHEPMLRAHDEWHRDAEGVVTGGAWDYTENRENLSRFWRGGIERMMSKGDGTGYESVVTIGMRGDGDEAMSESAAIPLLERIVTDQRAIIADVTGRPAEQTPQVWALYKEVQEYYDEGMQVPDDVILLFADDNWGQIRRLPDPAAQPRTGGYGVYYHFDYVGVPRNYKWLNTNQIEKTWQQMDLAYRRDARAMWIVNVGDIKTMEYPLSFFLAHAWNPEAMDPAALANYPQAWAEQTFGAEHAEELGEIMTAYSQYAARRKPELIDESSFPLGSVTPQGLDGGEFGRLVAEWDMLESRMLTLRERLQPDQLDAYYQLVEHPVAAMATLYRLYYATAWNRQLAGSNDTRANYFADQVEALFAYDRALTERYHALNGGKWDHMMSQVHMNYVSWNDPTQQTMPTIMRVGGDTPEDRRQTRPVFVDPAPLPRDVVVREAGDFARARSGEQVGWTAVPHLGRTRGALVAMPQGRPASGRDDGVFAEYDISLPREQPYELTLYLVPTLNTIGHGAMAIGVSVDDGPIQPLQIDLQATGGAQTTPAEQQWAQAVRDNAVELTTQLGTLAAGRHRIRIWRIDDNVVPQKLVVGPPGLPETYLGLPARS